MSLTSIISKHSNMVWGSMFLWYPLLEGQMSQGKDRFWGIHTESSYCPDPIHYLLILNPWLLFFCHLVLGGSEGCHKPPEKCCDMMTHRNKFTGQTIAVSPGEDLNQIQIYNWTQSQFKMFCVLKPALKQTDPILLEHLFGTQKFLSLWVQIKYSAVN